LAATLLGKTRAQARGTKHGETTMRVDGCATILSITGAASLPGQASRSASPPLGSFRPNKFTGFLQASYSALTTWLLHFANLMCWASASARRVAHLNPVEDAVAER
jgi:hypothetical protein